MSPNFQKFSPYWTDCLKQQQQQAPYKTVRMLNVRTLMLPKKKKKKILDFSVFCPSEEGENPPTVNTYKSTVWTLSHLCTGAKNSFT